MENDFAKKEISFKGLNKVMIPPLLINKAKQQKDNRDRIIKTLREKMIK